MTLYDWMHASWDLRANPPDLAILPVGATEPFGPHLPLGTAGYILDTVARCVGERLPGHVYLLPTFPLGASRAYTSFPGTVALSWRTLAAAITDLAESLLAAGVCRVTVLAGLGGAACSTVLPRENRIVKTAVRQLNYAHPELDAIWVQPLTVAEPSLSTLCPTAEEDVRAGQIATALMAHLHPEFVRWDRLVDHTPALGASYLDAVPFRALCPKGVWGRPSLASAELGERVLEAAVEGTAAYIVTSFRELARLKGRADSPWLRALGTGEESR